ncbi:MAG: guanylate kinase [Chitinophagaceae bacterium]|nr:guanylate kinase [Chitinophagaceae bacterium]
MSSDDTHKLIIITAPSGSGKTSVVNHLLQVHPQLIFSISACTRNPRPGETDGLSYYFISVDDFKKKIEADAFAEYEMVYEGKYYGTLKAELDRIWNQQCYPLVDIDVKGALKLKNQFGANAMSIFLKAPSIAELENRLRKRGTETEASLKERLDKAHFELSFENQFDHIVVNDQLENACHKVSELTKAFLQF